MKTKTKKMIEIDMVIAKIKELCGRDEAGPGFEDIHDLRRWLEYLSTSDWPGHSPRCTCDICWNKRIVLPKLTQSPR